MAGDDDTTPDPLFNNDLRRPRKEEPHPGGSVVVTNASGSPPASNNRPWSSATGDFFPNKAHVSDALRGILASLEASDLTLVYEKHMEASDRSRGQNRLLMSCKCETKRGAFASIFTDTEMPLVHRPPEALKTTRDDEEHDSSNHGKEDTADDEPGKQMRSVAVVQGLAVEAYDCDGRTYRLNLKYLSSNTAYRIIGPEWAVFLENNGLLVGGGGVSVTTRKPSAGRRRQKKRRRSSLPDGEEPPPSDIQMELWAFRSPKLSVGVKDQPEGALGLLLLHCHPQEAEAEDMVVAAGKLAVAAPRSTPLGPLERLAALWLAYNDRRRGC